MVVDVKEDEYFVEGFNEVYIANVLRNTNVEIIQKVAENLNDLLHYLHSLLPHLLLHPNDYRI